MRQARNGNGRSASARLRGSDAVAVDGTADSRLPANSGGKARKAGGRSSVGRRKGAPAAKRSKYGNQRLTFEGLSFDSKRELHRYVLLREMVRTGAISDLRRQVPFELAPGVSINGRRRPPLRYVADFVYRERGAAIDTIEDVKGVVTEAYRIKRHLMTAAGFVIREIR
ncbi:hypothetical protein R77567_01630 [Ralstonia sp. LMG 32965]|uniref:DUF1064 domain-containing protein n=1 Tax=Ralstonia flatus TaxID=3058601 RepID=A0AAD2BXQ8_9RALS|nr:DUF1064 domain-containing protein [Ralstonia sp. LMG 32965]MBN6211444.1 DUF1064 domain-containing protein [Ralstonia pickettii]CAJ0862240.1 hypothetical protein R77567_01630 [Ralstonia sp. LMG 32965]